MNHSMLIQNFLFKNGYKNYDIVLCSCVHSSNTIFMLAEDFANECLKMNGEGWITAQRVNVEYLLETLEHDSDELELLEVVYRRSRAMRNFH